MSLDQNTLLTAKELSPLIKFNPDYINRKLKDTVFLEGVHYIRPFGSRKIFYLWERVEKELYQSRNCSQMNVLIPMAKGGICHG
ncbi:hypothetical protein [Shewanella baltica]|jgi:hypothetical protein|uniref:hypothetical protein n=1 Tax=Shewanella baltica TaxID=62322 RepID=UPI000DF983A2|nr:hypothetical protein [Shewanella baltica]SUI57607.1 Uncharacterised protein [Shewanella baltica]